MLSIIKSFIEFLISDCSQILAGSIVLASIESPFKAIVEFFQTSTFSFSPYIKINKTGLVLVFSGHLVPWRFKGGLLNGSCPTLSDAAIPSWRLQESDRV